MSCETCGHTMEGFAAFTFHCPRCDTVKIIRPGHPLGDAVYVPKLVERCREFERSFPPGNPPTVSYSDWWKRLGITESIGPVRPQPEKG